MYHCSMYLAVVVIMFLSKRVAFLNIKRIYLKRNIFLQFDYHVFRSYIFLNKWLLLIYLFYLTFSSALKTSLDVSTKKEKN